MNRLPTQLLEQISLMSAIEIVAVTFAVLYLVLAIRQNIACWYCAGISTAFFVHVYFVTNLYMESLLNVFYFIMAIYGWQKWRTGNNGEGALPVTSWPMNLHAAAVIAISVAAAVSGFILETRTDAAFPYVDSATTFAAIWATFLVARKVLENWWYWLAIDTVSVFVNWSRGLELAAVLFLFYVLLIPIGLIKWTRSYRTMAVPA